MRDAKIVKSIIASNLFMTLATSANSIPWSCPLFFASDKDLNIYFTSYNNALHVKQIEQNPNVAVSIFDSHAMPGTGNTQAVYISGKCSIVLGEELAYAIEVVYKKRFPDPKEREKRDLSVERFSFPDSIGRTDHIYKIETDKFYILDKQTGKDTRIEVQMM
jgi:nitroimidazol reductase NimA-like FMN-containing flavoprotein (pyridoxamine 5'-phosphate oxidase superfamily)